MTTIEFAAPGLADHLAEIINAAYHAGEAGIWLDGGQRIAPAALGEMIADGEIAMAWRDGMPVGCVRVRRLDERTAELGMLSVAPEAFGTGLGRELLTFAERHYGTQYMQLELLVPRGAPHPAKVRLHEWYSRLGYREISRRDFARDYPDDAGWLVGPADLVTYRKSLRAAPAT